MPYGERRTHPRLAIQRTAIRNSLLAGRVLNMSLEGLAIETMAGLRVGTVYPFRVEFDDHTLHISVEVRWCKLVRTIAKGNGEVVAIFRAGLHVERPLTLFGERGMQNSQEWFEPELDVPK